MNADFAPEQRPFVRHAIETGRIHRPEETEEEALSLWVGAGTFQHDNHFGTRNFDKAQAQFNLHALVIKTCCELAVGSR
jgi:hypothetical protein